MIRNVKQSDAVELCRIYNYYVLNSISTFEENPVTAEEMEKRIGRINAAYPWIVYEEGGKIAGYAYATEWKPRSAYRFTVESSVYLDHEKFARGIGTRLYSALLALLAKQDFHTVLGGIALPNEASIKLHERLGFRKTGQLEKVGLKFGLWIDVGYWQKEL